MQHFESQDEKFKFTKTLGIENMGPLVLLKSLNLLYKQFIALFYKARSSSEILLCLYTLFISFCPRLFMG